MATEDSNGLVIFQDTDNLVPLHSTLNTLTASISDAFNENVRIYPVSSTSSRSTLVSQIGLSNISVSRPLFVWRSNAAQGRNLEYTTNGSTWHYYPSSDDVSSLVMTAGGSSPTYTLSGYRAMSMPEGTMLFGQFTRSSGYVTNGDRIGTFTPAPTQTYTVTAQAAGNVTTKVAVNGGSGGAITIASAPTGNTTYVRVDGWFIPR